MSDSEVYQRVLLSERAAFYIVQLAECKDSY